MIFERGVVATDVPHIWAMMASEDTPSDEVFIGPGFSWVLCDENEVVGFYSIKPTPGGPRLAHFCIKRQFRSPALALRLARSVRDKFKSIGVSMFYVDVKRPYLEKMVKWFFRPKSRYEKDGYVFFPVEVK